MQLKHDFVMVVLAYNMRQYNRRRVVRPTRDREKYSSSPTLRGFGGRNSFSQGYHFATIQILTCASFFMIRFDAYLTDIR